MKSIDLKEVICRLYWVIVENSVDSIRYNLCCRPYTVGIGESNYAIVLGEMTVHCHYMPAKIEAVVAVLPPQAPNEYCMCRQTNIIYQDHARFIGESVSEVSSIMCRYAANFLLDYAARQKYDIKLIIQ